jgi:hypothetical protein
MFPHCRIIEYGPLLSSSSGFSCLNCIGSLQPLAYLGHRHGPPHPAYLLTRGLANFFAWVGLEFLFSHSLSHK